MLPDQLNPSLGPEADTTRPQGQSLEARVPGGALVSAVPISLVVPRGNNQAKRSSNGLLLAVQLNHCGGLTPTCSEDKKNGEIRELQRKLERDSEGY